MALSSVELYRVAMVAASDEVLCEVYWYVVRWVEVVRML